MVFPEHTTHCAISIRQDVFEACTEAMDRPDLNTKFFAPNYLYVPETLPRLRAYLNQLHRMLSQRSPLLQRPNFQQLILQDFLPLLVTTLPLQQDPLKTTVKSFQRSLLVKQAEDYMQSHLNQPLTLTDLCNALGTSSRALSYGFQEMFGMSPMAYLKTLRLQGVYRVLKAADPSNKTIVNIAHQFGFWSLGHFTRDYKQMFGELPSETFKR
jgi:AraC family ethanolamine operon transcriptional activator